MDDAYPFHIEKELDISTYMEDMWIGYIPAHQMDTYDIPHSIYPTTQPIGCYRDVDGTMHIFQDGK